MTLSKEPLRIGVPVLLLIGLISSFQMVAAQSSSANRRAAPSLVPKPNRQIASILREIDARNIEHTIRALVSFGTRNTLSEQNDPKRGIGAARDWLYSEFLKAAEQSGGRMTVEKQAYEQPSGTAAVLEMARVMARYKFDATIVFMTVAGEEQSLLGSTYFAEQAKKNNVDIEAMFTNDIIGSSLGGNGVHDARTVRVFSEGVPSNETPEEANTRRSVGGENDAPSRQLARFIKETAATYVPQMKVTLVYRRDRYGRGGDHMPFVERGYPAVRFTEPNEDYRHQHQNVRVENGIQYGDLPQFDDYSYIANVARINAAALAMAALAPARPKNVMILTARLSNDTDLKWDANKESDLAGYEIVWRDTTSPVWTNSKMVGDVTTYTMKGMSKDNFFFGVRAIDNEGNRSPVTFPRPLGRPTPSDRATPATPTP